MCVEFYDFFQGKTLAGFDTGAFKAACVHVIDGIDTTRRVRERNIFTAASACKSRAALPHKDTKINVVGAPCTFFFKHMPTAAMLVKIVANINPIVSIVSNWCNRLLAQKL